MRKTRNKCFLTFDQTIGHMNVDSHKCMIDACKNLLFFFYLLINFTNVWFHMLILNTLRLQNNWAYIKQDWKNKPIQRQVDQSKPTWEAAHSISSFFNLLSSYVRSKCEGKIQVFYKHIPTCLEFRFPLKVYKKQISSHD